MQHMLQKITDFDILELLLKNDMHVRSIAKVLKATPSTIMRKLRVLVDENIVDMKLSGKNTTYYIRDTPEAKSYVLMTEQYKFFKALKSPLLRRISKEISERTNGELVILFGSYAKNLATKDSDIDIYVETSDENLKQSLSAISLKLSVKTGKFNKNAPLEKEIIKDHIILSNAERFYALIK